MQVIFGWMFKAFIEWAANKIAALIARFKKQQQNKSEAESNAKADTEKLEKIKPDSTKEETDVAIDEASKRM